MKRLLSVAGLVLSSTFVQAGGPPETGSLPAGYGPPPAAYGTPLPIAERPAPGKGDYVPPGLGAAKGAQPREVVADPLQDIEGTRSLNVRKPLEAAPAPRPPVNDTSLEALKAAASRLQAARQAAAAQQASLNSLTLDTQSEDARAAAKLQAELADLLQKLEARKRAKPAESSLPLPLAAKPTPASDTATPSILPQAQDHFQAGRYSLALPMLQNLVAGKLSDEDRVLVQYLTAGCMNRLGKPDEAKALYQQVTTSHGDQTLVDSAAWHVEAIGTRLDLQRQVSAMRQRRAER